MTQVTAHALQNDMIEARWDARLRLRVLTSRLQAVLSIEEYALVQERWLCQRPRAHSTLAGWMGMSTRRLRRIEAAALWKCRLLLGVSPEAMRALATSADTGAPDKPATFRVQY